MSLLSHTFPLKTDPVVVREKTSTNVPCLSALAVNPAAEVISFHERRSTQECREARLQTLTLTRHARHTVLSTISTSSIAVFDSHRRRDLDREVQAPKHPPPSALLPRPPAHRAAMTGIHGVSSSEWLPINQSTSGKRVLSFGVIAPS